MSELKSDWLNEDLAGYFEKVPMDVFRDYSIRGGIEDGCDINILYPLLENTKSLIEIGASYGRVVDHLLNKGYMGKIFAIERSKHFCRILGKKYHEDDNKTNVIIVNCDIKDYIPCEKVDYILWMWSDIASFSPSEQPKIIKLLQQWLNPNGVLVIETLLHTQISLNATQVLNNDSLEGQSYVIDSPYGTLYGYIPTENEVRAYAISAGLSPFNQIYYCTNTGRKRMLHFFRLRATNEN